MNLGRVYEGRRADPEEGGTENAGDTRLLQMAHVCEITLQIATVGVGKRNICVLILSLADSPEGDSENIIQHRTNVTRDCREFNDLDGEFRRRNILRSLRRRY